MEKILIVHILLTTQIIYGILKSNLHQGSQ